MAPSVRASDPFPFGVNVEPSDPFPFGVNVELSPTHATVRLHVLLRAITCVMSLDATPPAPRIAGRRRLRRRRRGCARSARGPTCHGAHFALVLALDLGPCRRCRAANSLHRYYCINLDVGKTQSARLYPSAHEPARIGNFQAREELQRVSAWPIRTRRGREWAQAQAVPRPPGAGERAHGR